jgi:hypothetical protein
MMYFKEILDYCIVDNNIEKIKNLLKDTRSLNEDYQYCLRRSISGQLDNMFKSILDIALKENKNINFDNLLNYCIYYNNVYIAKYILYNYSYKISENILLLAYEDSQHSTPTVFELCRLIKFYLYIRNKNLRIEKNKKIILLF